MRRSLLLLAIGWLVACQSSNNQASMNGLEESCSLRDLGMPMEIDEALTAELRKVHTDPGYLPELQLVREERVFAMPLKHTDVAAVLTGSVAEVTVTQTYKNPLNEAIEATYLFPLPENSAVNGMQIKIGERVVQAKIQKREEAKHTYDTAKAAGKTAALLEQQRPNVFKQSVANIAPNEEIDVVVTYVQDLTFEAGEYEFVFPMVIGPRFFPPIDGSAEAWTRAVTNAQGVNPPLLGGGARSGHDISLSVRASVGFPILEYKVPTHQVEARVSASGLFLTLSRADSLPNRDFVLRYRVDGDVPKTSLLANHGEEDGYFMLTTTPPSLDLKQLVGDREVVFVVDVSGSMSGDPLAMCKDAMREALRQLRPVDTFNVYSYAGNTDQLFTLAVPANEANITQAERFIDKMSAGGGTYMVDAIERVLSPEVASGRNRYVFFMTDGDVGNEITVFKRAEDYVAALKAKQQKAQVFSFGVGSAPNREALEGLAKAGQGVAVYASNREDPTRAVNTFFRYIDHSIIEDVSIDWGGLIVSEVYPTVVPDLFASHPLTLFGRYQKGGRATITINGTKDGKKISIPVEVELPVTEKENAVLSTLWARAKIADLLRDLWASSDPQVAEEAITALGLTYQIVTQYTSFVAVDESRIVGNGAPPSINQATHTAEDVARAIANNNSGTMGMIKGSGGGSSPFASVFGREDVVGTDPEDIVGGLLGDRPGGLGLRGAGIGGGGTGEGTIGLGNDNTVGKGGGAGFGGYTADSFEVIEGKAEVKGSLDKDIIRRVIRRAMPGIKFCYEQALLSNPKLAGKLKIALVIAENGAVSSAAPADSIDATVDACVARRISQLSFPAPQDGGIVIVTYPFTFKPSSK